MKITKIQDVNGKKSTHIPKECAEIMQIEKGDSINWIIHPHGHMILSKVEKKYE